MKILFSHGKESGPWGSKIKHLASVAEGYGCDVDSLDYRAIKDPDLRVEHLIAALQGPGEDIVLVGSSMGGYVSLLASEQFAAKGIFLLAPALYMPGYGRQDYPTCSCHMEIVHGWSDEVIPFQNSIRFAQKRNAVLHLIPGDHRLNSSIETVESLFRNFLSVILAIQTGI